MSFTTAYEAVNFLRERAARIRELEAEAGRLLHECGDEAGYRRLMHAKALLLASLPEDAGILPTGPGGFEPGEARRVEAGLAGFAGRAGQALDLGSVFYMSALLYPEEYRDGEPNDLERFIDGIMGG